MRYTVPTMRWTSTGVALFPWLLSMTFISGLQGNQNRLKEVYKWKQIDFAFPSPEARRIALTSGTFKPAHNLPLGIEVWEDRIFIALPRWKDGVPATLTCVSRDPRGNISPLLNAFPNWSWHLQNNCDGITSVFRMSVDPCGRLWVLDSGAIDIVNDLTQKCPPQVLVFDLRTDTLLWRYRLPDDQVKEGSLFTNIVVDVQRGRCDDAYVYMSDVFRYGLVVYSWREDRSWRINHNFFFPDPLACEYELHGLTFRWTDGIFGLALSPDDKSGDRTLYFHPMSSFREFSVPTSVLRNETAAEAHPEKFVTLQEARGRAHSQSSASAMDARGVMFYNLVTQDAVGCWNSRQPLGYRADLQGVVARDNTSLVFPNDIKVDQGRRQTVWVLSNRLHDYLYRKLDPNDVNFRILSVPADVAVKGTVCDPNYVHVPTLSRIGCDL